MKEVGLKEKSYHGFIYSQVYNENPSNQPNLCDYFWKVVSCFVFLPFIWVPLCFPRRWRLGGFWQAVAITLLCYVINVMLVGLGFSISDKREWGWVWWQNYLLGLGVMTAGIIGIIIVCIILYGVCFGVKWCYDKVFLRNDSETSLVVARWKAFKGKYCPRIQWR